MSNRSARPASPSRRRFVRALILSAGLVACPWPLRGAPAASRVRLVGHMRLRIRRLRFRDLTAPHDLAG